ncbi:MAG TPA: thioredoxin family protein [Thermomicrobiales bacterium]|nr:thioredoxin family protein [Thermomicrobiales bacterium]
MNPADYWDAAMEVDEYVGTMTLNQAVFAERIETTELTDEQRRLFAGDPVRILVLTEDFCGDSAQLIPPVARLARESDNVEVRVLRRDEHRDLAAGYRRKDGYQAIPVFIVLGSDGQERGFVIERPHLAYAEMAAETRRFAAEHPELEGVNRTYDRMPDATRAAVRANVERFRLTRTTEWVAALFDELATAAWAAAPAGAARD